MLNITKEFKKKNLFITGNAEQILLYQYHEQFSDIFAKGERQKLNNNNNVNTNSPIKIQSTEL